MRTGEAGRTLKWMRKNYFSFLSGVVLALTIWGFSDNLIWNVTQPSNHDPKFVIHGLFCLAWMVVLFAQANFIRASNFRLHRKLGIIGFIIAVGVTLSTIYVFVAVWKGWDVMAFYVKANRLLLLSFSLFVTLGFLYRKRKEWHKRFMYMGTLFMLEPVLSRAFDPVESLMGGLAENQIDFYWWIFFILTWNALFLSMFVYDWVVIRKIHPVTVLGFAWVYLIWLIVFLI